MALSFNQLFVTMRNIGMVDSFLPFLLIFTIVYAMLEKTKVLGEEGGKPKSKFNGIVAAVIALLAVIPHVTRTYPPNADVVLIINNFLPNIALVIISIIMLLTLTGIMDTKLDALIPKNYLTGVAIAIVLLLFAIAAGWIQRVPRWLMWAMDPNTQALAIIILVFGVVIYMITK